MVSEELIELLRKKADEYNQPFFIKHDPISVPHRFNKKQDIEIAAFFASVFAWGNRTTIINKTNELMNLMHQSPHDFCLNHSAPDLKSLLHFKHRTFNSTDLLYFVDFFNKHYQRSDSLETAFSDFLEVTDDDTGGALDGFYQYFFSLEHVPKRTLKHIAAPAKNSACKRINMFLRWMVRQDDNGVDFGLWKKIKPSQLVLPLDLHVVRVARHFNMIRRKATDWQTALELTNTIKEFEPLDPCKYDFALFALGVFEKF